MCCVIMCCVIMCCRLSCVVIAGICSLLGFDSGLFVAAECQSRMSQVSIICLNLEGPAADVNRVHQGLPTSLFLDLLLL